MKKLLLLISILSLSKDLFSQNIGIGTTTPGARLHVSGTPGNIAIFNGGSQMFVTLAEGGINRGYIGSYSGNAEDVDFGTYDDNNTGKVHLTTDNLPRLTVINNGNIGIGTTTPVAKLHIKGTGSGTQIVLEENAGSSLRISNEATAIGPYMGTTSNHSLTLIANNAGRMTILGNGNVGVGTNNPEQLFSVAGGMVIDQSNLNNGTPTTMLRFGSFSGEGIGSRRTAGTNQYGLDLYTQGINRMTIANGGNVGIGLINPSSKLEVRGPLGFSSSIKKWEMNYDSIAGYFYIDEYGAGRRLFIKNGGNVGVNTSNPQATLDVNGDLNIENKLLLNSSPGNDGQVLMSSGGGAAPVWRNAAFSNLDRFLFKTQYMAGPNNADFFDTILYNNVYAMSSAITYTNSLFTVNKSGLYSVDVIFHPFSGVSNTNDHPFTRTIMYIKYPALSFNTIELDHQVMTRAYSIGYEIHRNTLQHNYSLYLSAGTQFYFRGIVTGINLVGSSGFFGGSLLSINFIAD